MGFSSFAAAAGLLFIAGCGGAEFSATGGESGAQGESGSQIAAGGDSQATSGGAGTMIGNGGAGGVVGGTVDASVTGGSGGQSVIDSGPRPDVSGGSGGAVVVVDATVDVGSAESGPAPSCPLAEPTMLGHCNGTLKCTYGTQPRLSCRKTYTCSGGQWALTPSMMCPDLPVCAPPFPQVGFSCTGSSADCIWDSGLYCRCLACPDMGCPKWDCFPPPSNNNCGKTPPNLGQPCSASMPATCEFGACSLGSRVTVTCVNGAINWSFPNCQ